MRRLVLIAAFALLAAACGSGESAVTFASPDAGSGGAVSPSTTTTQPQSDEGPAGPTTTAAPSAPIDVPESDYPDVVVADLAGGEMNLKELALEEEPVLLWFWAPH